MVVVSAAKWRQSRKLSCMNQKIWEGGTSWKDEGGGGAYESVSRSVIGRSLGTCKTRTLAAGGGLGGFGDQLQGNRPRQPLPWWLIARLMHANGYCLQASVYLGSEITHTDSLHKSYMLVVTQL